MFHADPSKRCAVLTKPTAAMPQNDEQVNGPFVPRSECRAHLAWWSEHVPTPASSIRPADSCATSEPKARRDDDAEMVEAKAAFAPMWVWLALVVVLVAAAAASTSNGGKDKASSTSAATEATDATTEPSTEAPKISETTETAISVVTAETAPTTEVIEAPTTQPPALPPSNEAAGTPAGITGDRTNPVPAGAIADIGSGWRLQVLNVNVDAAAAVAAENQFNEPPPIGSTFTLITVAIGYFGLEDPKSAFETTISAVGAANVELAADCGVIPQQLNAFGELFSGGVAIGNVCFVTTPEDTASLQLYATGQLFGGDQVFLSTSPVADTVVPILALTGPQAGAASSLARLAPTALGIAADIGEGWKLSVNGAARDITDETLAENQFNEPPPDGFRFFGVDVTYSYDGPGSASAFTVTTKAVGNENRELTTGCGVTPGEVDRSADIFSGGTVSGTICFVVPAGSPALVVYANAGFSGDSIMFATA